MSTLKMKVLHSVLRTLGAKERVFQTNDREPLGYTSTIDLFGNLFHVLHSSMLAWTSSSTTLRDFD